MENIVPPFLSDSQFAAILAALGVIGGGFIATAKWAVGRVVKALDDSSADRQKQTEAFIMLRGRVDDVHDFIQGREPVEPPARLSRNTPKLT